MRHKYTVELLLPVIASSYQWAEVCRKLNVSPFTGAQTHIKKVANKLGIDFSHFKGAGWSRGLKVGPKRPIEAYLVRNSTVKSDSLKKRLFAEGIKNKLCENCGLSNWLDKSIPLELDHINHDHWDNRLENLKILCPNCHAMKHSPL